MLCLLQFFPYVPHKENIVSFPACFAVSSVLNGGSLLAAAAALRHLYVAHCMKKT
jgi:hypothetical protein